MKRNNVYAIRPTTSTRSSSEFMENDLRKSGLSEDDIDVQPLPVSEHGVPGYRIVYPGPESMYRDRLKDHRPKYLAPTGTTGVWFASEGKRVAWAEAEYRLIVEGEKKAAAAEKYLELSAAGIGGCYGWSNKGSLLVPLRSGLDKCKKIYVVLDSDLQTNPKVNGAAFALHTALREHGYKGIVKFVELPQAESGKSKVGLDDWLLQQRPDDLTPRELRTRFRALPEIIIDRQEVPPLGSLATLPHEWRTSPLHPPCIVETYLYQDVGVLSGPGGTGKTTQALYEAVCIVLGRPLYGHFEVHRQGRVLFITAEDRKVQLVARLREICKAMHLSEKEERLVRQSILIWDVVGRDLRLLTAANRGGGIQVAPVVQRMVEEWKNQDLVLINLDPMIAFGIDEERVNTNAHALVTAGRQVMSELGVCFRWIHHVSQAAARGKLMDQYAARGGSALTDGCRMVAILQTFDQYSDKEQGGLKLPEGLQLTEGESVTVLARPKLSHCAPQTDKELWVARNGFAFRGYIEQKLTLAEQAELDDKIAALLMKGKSIRVTAAALGVTKHRVVKVKENKVD